MSPYGIFDQLPQSLAIILGRKPEQCRAQTRIGKIELEMGYPLKMPRVPVKTVRTVN
jgi:hypothetical protein